MWQKMLAVLGLVFSGLVLTVSVMRSSEQTAYAYELSEQLENSTAVPETIDSHSLARLRIGHKLRDASQLFEDRFQVWIADSGEEKAEVYSDIAKERMMKVEELMSRGDYEQAMKTAAKGTRYLQLAQQESTAAGDLMVLEELVETSYIHEEILLKMSEVDEVAGLPMKDRLLDEVLLLRSEIEQKIGELGS